LWHLCEDIGPGLHILGFERRVSILFRVRKAAVEIVRILYGGRDYGHLLSIADT
jgi:toxin ParE1/3/4